MQTERHKLKHEWVVTSKLHEPSTFPSQVFADVDGGIESLRAYGVRHTEEDRHLEELSACEWDYDQDARTLYLHYTEEQRQQLLQLDSIRIEITRK